MLYYYDDSCGFFFFFFFDFSYLIDSSSSEASSDILLKKALFAPCSGSGYLLAAKEKDRNKLRSNVRETNSRVWHCDQHNRRWINFLVAVTEEEAIRFRLDRSLAASSTDAKHLKYFLVQQQQQNQTIIFQALRACQTFFQKDAHIIIKLHIQVYPCHHVLEVVKNDKNISGHHGLQSGQLWRLRLR